MQKQKIVSLLIILIVIAFIVSQITLAVWWNPFSWGIWNSIFHFQRQVQNLVTGNEKACADSGGKVSTVDCYCYGAKDFYNTCVIGACSCPPLPQNKRELKTCDCGESKCWDGTKCVNLPFGQSENTPANNTTAGFRLNTVASANSQFASDLYAKLNNNKDNIFFSPFSISSAMAMVYEGAKGETANEIGSVMHFPQDNALLRNSFASLYSDINAKGKPYALSTANALWAEKTHSFLASYKNTIQQYYSGDTTNLDFIGNAEGSRQTINNWVAGKTNNKITNLIGEGSITPLTRLILTNAIYFKGTWESQFDAKDTKPEDFTVSPGNKTKVQMMSMPGEHFDYAENNDLQAIELPYKGGDLSMVILLPKGNNLSSAEKYINPKNFSDLMAKLQYNKVNLYIPKFKLETQYQLADTLLQMGMPTAFSTNADFSGMDGQKDLFISFVIHKAYIDVDELGTEAAAATGIGMATSAAPVPEKIFVFRADHPFIFAIKENSTGNILFLGNVINPNK